MTGTVRVWQTDSDRDLAIMISAASDGDPPTRSGPGHTQDDCFCILFHIDFSIYMFSSCYFSLHSMMISGIKFRRCGGARPGLLVGDSESGPFKFSARKLVLFIIMA